VSRPDQTTFNLPETKVKSETRKRGTDLDGLGVGCVVGFGEITCAGVGVADAIAEAVAVGLST
jgi:hypothetical protein